LGCLESLTEYDPETSSRPPCRQVGRPYLRRAWPTPRPQEASPELGAQATKPPPDAPPEAQSCNQDGTFTQHVMMT
jgi:hypothetical protein